MTPKEKAKELVKKFMATTHSISRIKVDGKQCALICVDEILNSIKFNSDLQPKYWHEVKQEIEKL